MHILDYFEISLILFLFRLKNEVISNENDQKNVELFSVIDSLKNEIFINDNYRHRLELINLIISGTFPHSFRDVFSSAEHRSFIF